MSEPLALRVPLMPDECPPSLMSRLAARNCTDLAGLAADMRLSPIDVADGAGEALAKLAVLASVDADALRGSAIIRDGDGWTLRGERLSRTTLRRHRLHVCARCLAEDVAGVDEPDEAAHVRATWLVEQVRTCPRHGVPLVPAGDPTVGSVRSYDIVGRLRPLLCDLDRLAAEAVPRGSSALESYLCDRLQGQRGNGWLDGLPFHVAAVTCERVGAVVLHGPDVAMDRLNEHDLWAAGDAGHAIVERGADGFAKFHEGMRSLVSSASSRTDGRKLFGNLWEFLRTKEEDPAFEPVRAMMVGQMAATKPVEGGSVILGVPVEKRVLHSISSGALATGVHVKTFRAVLEREGLLDASAEPASPGRTTVAADKVAGILRRLEDSLSYTDAVDRIGAPRHAAWAIYKAGLIAPRSRMDEGSHNRKLYIEFDRGDLDAFLARLAHGAVECAAPHEDEVTIQRAARENHCSIVEVTRLILEGRLPWTGRLASEAGFSSILVRSVDVAPLVRGDDPPGIPESRVRHRLHAHEKSVPSLVEAGLLEVFEARHPRTRVPQRYVSLKTIESFEASYASLTTRAIELGMSPNRLKARLSVRNVLPALEADRFHTAFYLRSDLPDRA